MNHPERRTGESGEGPAPAATSAAFALAGALAVLGAALLLLATDPHFFWHDDYQLQYLPVSREIARSWLEDGAFPLLSPYTWLASALAGEFQYGVFSLFQTLLNVVAWNLGLSLVGTATFLSIAQMMVLGAGAALLARSFGVSVPLAAMVAVVAAANGYQLAWGATDWVPTLSSSVWLPWYWWTLQTMRTAPRSRGLPFLSGLFLYLLITAGWPYTILMAVIVTLAYGVSAARHRDVGRLLAMGVAGAFGTALSLPALIALVEHYAASLRKGVTTLNEAWSVPPTSLPGLVLPTHQSLWLAWGSPQTHAAVELAGAFVPVVGVLAGCLLLRRALLRETPGSLPLFAVGIAGFLLMVIPGSGPFRWSFRWLPLVHLALALAGAAGLEGIRRRAGAAGPRPAEGSSPSLRGRWNAGLWGTGVVLLATAAALVLDTAPARTIRFAGLLIVVTLLWIWLDARRFAIARWMPAAASIFSVVALPAFVPYHLWVPTWAFDDAVREAAPFDPSIRYLALYRWGDILEADGLHPEMRPGNTPMFAGIRYVNGYSPMRPAGMALAFDVRDHGEMGPARAEWVLRREAAGGRFLDWYSIDGLVVPNDLFAAAGPHLPRWKVAGEVPGATILHRKEPLRRQAYAATDAVIVGRPEAAYKIMLGRILVPEPIVLLRPGAATSVTRFEPAVLGSIQETRQSASVAVDTTGNENDSLVVFTRPFFDGYEATLGEEPLDVELAHASMPAVRVPAGRRGILELRFRPSWITWGPTAAVAGVLVCVLIAVAAPRLLTGAHSAGESR